MALILQPQPADNRPTAHRPDAPAAPAGPAAPGQAPGRRRLGLEQLLVAGGQMGAGLGNLVFTLVAARLLAPSDFARLSVFLGLYLVLSLPATSLSAATALEPGRRDSLVKGVAAVSISVAALGAALSPWIGAVLHLPVIMVLVLAASVPAAGGLALDRGRLYGQQAHRRVVASLVAEPAVRLGVGVALAAWIGAVGGAEGVVLAAYIALEVARPRVRGSGGHSRARRSLLGRRRRPVPLPYSFDVEGSATPDSYVPVPEPALADRTRAATHAAGPADPRRAATYGAVWTAAAFALLAVVQNQDLVFANALLPGAQAGQYAALSTLGGAAAFATITIPMVLLPRAARRERHSLSVALAIAVALGLAAVAVGAAGGGSLVRVLFGTRYDAVGGLVAPYLAAMGLLGVARVLIAERCATGGARRVTALAGLAAATQAAMIAAIGHGVGSIAFSTLAATASLTAALAGERIMSPARRGALRQWVAWVTRDRTAQLVFTVTAAALVVRLIVWRGIWLDEATSVYQVHMSFAHMLSNLRDTDVHPPLYFSVLWVDVRAFGYGSMAIRVPSIVAGLLVVPACYAAARDLWDRRTGLVAAAIASVGPLLVWYSQEVRMYSMFMLFAVLAIWGQCRALKHGRVADWALYAGASAALVWTEYFGLFQVVAQQLFFLWVIWRRRSDPDRPARPLAVSYLAATAAIVLMLLPLAPFAWHQFMVNQNAGKGFGAPSQTSLPGTQTISVYTVLANLAWAAIGYHSGPIMEGLVALWPFGILLSLYVLGRRATRQTHLVLTAAVIPALLLFLAGEEKRFLYDVRYMSGVAVVMVLLGARLITGGMSSRRFQMIGCLALVAILATGLFDEQFNGTNPRLYDFQGALAVVNHQWQPGDVLLYEPESLAPVLAYYAPHDRTGPAGDQVPAVAPGRTVFVLASKSLMAGGQPAQLGQLLSHLGQADRAGPVIHKSNVTLWTFTSPRVPASGAAK
jgi:O-antigen/teichoic acid export membrane protein